LVYWRRGAVLAALTWGLGVAGAVPAVGAPTNYVLVRDTARAACDQLADAAGKQSTVRSVTLQAKGTAAGNFLVENTLAAAMTAAGWRVTTRPDSSSGMVLEYEVVDLGLSYTHSYRNAWLGEKRVAREARARVFARLVDQGANKVLWADQAESRQSDEVAAKELPALEEKNPADYVKATLPPQRWNRLVEPVVVTAIIAGLIILFFSNQNTSS